MSDLVDWFSAVDSFENFEDDYSSDDDVSSNVDIEYHPVFSPEPLYPSKFVMSLDVPEVPEFIPKDHPYNISLLILQEHCSVCNGTLSYDNFCKASCSLYLDAELIVLSKGYKMFKGPIRRMLRAIFVDPSQVTKFIELGNMLVACNKCRL